MPFVILSAILQIACIVHAVRTGRVQYWPIIILIGSLLGCLAYFLVEILPELRNSRTAKRVVANVARTIDPEKRKREITAQLDIADTVQNRVRLAEECLQLGDWQNARVLYERCLSGPYADDPNFLLGRARAEAGQKQARPVRPRRRGRGVQPRIPGQPGPVDRELRVALRTLGREPISPGRGPVYGGYG